MRVKRHYTVDSKSPYEGIAFRSANSEIRNPDGSIVFRLEGISVPASWSQVACDVLAQKYFGVEPLIAGQGDAEWGIAIDVDEPRSLGADRALNAIAAHEKYEGDLIVIDFGTATTFDAIDFNGAYKGGIIAPGLNLSLDALVGNTAKLPRIAIEAPCRRDGPAEAAQHLFIEQRRRHALGAFVNDEAHRVRTDVDDRNAVARGPTLALSGRARSGAWAPFAPSLRPGRAPTSWGWP